MPKYDLELKADHIGGNFEWENGPSCCSQLDSAIADDKFIFVSNITDDGNNSVYLMPLSSDGSLVRRSGIPISYCPWCGTQIRVRKKYRTQD